VAHGDLARALSRQTTAQSAGGPIQVRLSFRTADGRHCRTFTAPELHLAGLACRTQGRWAAPVVVALRPAGPTEFRMAGSETPPAVLAAVDAMIQGDPLDPAEEVAAIGRGWRP